MLRTFFLLVATQVCVCALRTPTNNPSPFQLPHWARGGELFRLLQKQKHQTLKEPLGPQPALIANMPLDHFNASDTRTMPVRYWVALCHKGKQPSALFVHMGGEAASGGVYCDERAKQHNAVVVQVEHRFYGQSVPQGSSPLADPLLRFLTVEQNLADTKAVAETVCGQHHTCDKVVAFGGSYSGSTCAFFRLTYPDLVKGCWSESGVVNNILDFPQFDSHVATALKNYSQKCHDTLRSLQEAVDAAFARGQGDAVKRMFNGSSMIGTKFGDSDFFYAIADGPAMLDQYGQKKDMCKFLAAGAKTDEEKISLLANLINHFYGPKFVEQCFYDSECFKTQLGATTQGVGSRQWRWQKCTQMRFLQAAPSSSPLRSPALTIDVLTAQCRYAFGATVDPRSAGDTLRKKFWSGPTTLRGSGIFFINYSDDPWLEASYPVASSYTEAGFETCVVSCDGCGHCGSGAPMTNECRTRANQWLAALLQ